MKSLERQVVLVTGGTDGLGRALADEFARHGATLLIHGRSEEKGAKTVDEIRRHTPGDVAAFVRADLSRFSEVRELAEVVRSKVDRLDVLVNNAGIYPDARAESPDGCELTLQVNYLSHVLLTRLLLPLISASAPARIVNVASAGQEPLDFDDLMMRTTWSGGSAYCRSKLAQIMFTMDLAQELSGRRVAVNALHPATYMPTKMVVGRFPPTNSIEEGVRATFRLAADDRFGDVTGRYFNMQSESRANAQAYDQSARRRLADETARILAPYLG